MTDRDNNGRVWGIVWTEVFPWLIIFRTFRIAISFRLLFLGAIGMVLTLYGTNMISRGISGQPFDAKSCIDSTAIESMYENAPIDIPWQAPQQQDGTLYKKLKGKSNTPILSTWDYFKMPFCSMKYTRGRTSVGYFAAWLWIIFIWGFFGTAIARASAVKLARGGRISTYEIFCFALSKWRSSFAAPLMPLIAMILLAIPVFVLGWLLHINVLEWIGAFAWPIALLIGIAIAVLMIWLVFGWPLMISAIAVEGSDSFDSLSRTYSYIYQRPLHFLFYVFLAVLFGALGWAFVVFFGNMVLGITDWIADWKHMPTGEGFNPSTIVGIWVWFFKLLVIAFSVTYFWSASVAIYLLLRRNTDAVEMDEIYSENNGVTRELPKIVTDEQGAPTVQE